MSLIESLILVLVVYFIFLMMFYKVVMDFESVSPYECGFDPNSITRVTFSYRFFLISILFLIFDVEISLMLPFPFIMNNFVSVWLFYLFVFTLIVGLLYEYNQGSLEWMDSFVSKA